MGDDRHAIEPAARTFLVEHYWPGVTGATFAEAVERIRAMAAVLAAAGQPVEYLHSTLVPDEETAFCVLAAESRALVEDTYARAGVRFERIVDAVETTVASAVASGDEQLGAIEPGPRALDPISEAGG